jgi:hypothetical protein
MTYRDLLPLGLEHTLDIGEGDIHFFGHLFKVQTFFLKTQHNRIHGFADLD